MNPTPAPSRRWSLPAFALGVLAIVSIVRLMWMWRVSAAGLDFSDEGYYLAWIAHPFDYRASATQFGFVYHPLWQWLSGDVAALRRVNLLFTAGLGVALGYASFRRLGVAAIDGTGTPVGPGISLLLALACLTFYPQLFDQWLPTPSYNSLALQGLLLATTGMASIHPMASRRGVQLGACLIGLGGVICFLAKPTTAAALAALVLLYLGATRTHRTSALALMVCVAVLGLLGSAWLIDGSVAAFAARLGSAVDIARAMGIQPPLSKLLRFDSFRMSRPDVAILLVVTVGLAWATDLLLRARSAQGLTMAVLAVGLALALLLTGAAAGAWRPEVLHGSYRGVWMLAIPLAALGGVLRTLSKTWDGRFDRPTIAWALALACMPHILAFGTGNNYWQVGMAASGFWCLSGLALLAPWVRQSGLALLLPSMLTIQALATTLFWMALGQPYRQPALLEMPTSGVQVLAMQGTLRVDAATARYVQDLQRQAENAGWRAGGRIIDLTGQSPGTLFLLGGRPLGQPWLLGGYPGSERAALQVLAGEDCAALASAWVLVQPDGPRALSAELLRSAGIDPVLDLARAAMVQTPAGFGGYAQPGIQFLLRPVRAPMSAEAACRQARQSRA